MDGIHDFEMQQQQPLLSDGLSAGSPSGGPSPLLALNEPRRRSKKAARSSLSPARFCIGFCAVIGLIVAGVLSWGLYTAGKAFWESISRPHREVSLPPDLHAQGLHQDKDLVRSYFGPKSDGAFLDTFDLGASIYARVRALPEVEEEGTEFALLEGEEEHKVVLDKIDEELGRERHPPSEGGEWVLVYRGVVLKDVPISTKPVQTTVSVAISADLLSSLNDPSLRPELVSSFVLLPPSSDNSSLSDDFSHGHRATVQSALPRYPEDDALPPPWASYSDNSTGWSSMDDFFSSAATTEPLGRRALDPRDPNGLTLDVLTRSWVTLARDFARYERGTYEKAMTNLRAQDGSRGFLSHGFRQPSNGALSFSSAQWRKFSTDGHFGTLLELQDRAATDDETGNEVSPPVNSSQLWYAPFITASLGAPSPKDYVSLSIKNTTSDTDNFSFDWRITFSTSSPAKLALLNDFSMSRKHGLRPSNMTTHAAATAHEAQEFMNALVGHPFDPSGRPITRGLLRMACNFLSLLSMPLFLYYWMKQSLTTGISMPSRLIFSCAAVIFETLYAVRGYRLSHLALWQVVLKVGWAALLLWVQTNLALRLEWTWGVFRGWIPVGVSRRRPTHSERASARADASFLWRDRIILFVGICLLERFLPSLHLIAASPPLPTGESAYTFRTTPDTSLFVRTVVSLVDPFSTALWYSVIILQCLLNVKRQTFAGQLKTNAHVLLLLAVLETAPAVLQGFLGRAELMEPFTVWDGAALALAGWRAWQAWTYPVVAQEESEDD